MQYRLVGADGRTRHIRERGEPIADEMGESTRTFATLQDITSQIEAEGLLRRAHQALRAKARDTEAQLHHFIDHTQAMVFIKDVEGRYQLINKRFEEVYEVTADTVTGKLGHEIFDPDFAAVLRADDEKVMAEGVPMEFDTPVPMRDGLHHFMSVKFPMYDADGKLQGIGGLATEITDRKRDAAERERLVDTLEDRNAELERFAYTVSHDLRSPLITIRGFLGLIGRDLEMMNLSQIGHDLKRADEAAKHMYDLLDQMLELCRTSRKTIDPMRLALEEVAHKAVRLVQGYIAESDVRIGISPDLPVVWGNEARLLEVFQNLLENAVKFMGEQPDARIWIGARRGNDEENIVFVKDNGIGIEEIHHKRVFDLFEVLDPALSGTGVGLALVKRIVEAHNGRIWVESEGVGCGTTFCFVIGVPNDDPPDNHEQKPPPLARKRA